MGLGGERNWLLFELRVLSTRPLFVDATVCASHTQPPPSFFACVVAMVLGGKELPFVISPLTFFVFVEVVVLVEPTPAVWPTARNVHKPKRPQQTT